MTSAPRGCRQGRRARLYRPLIEEFAGARVNIGAAAGRDHSDIAFDEAGDQSPLPIAKVVLAITFEHFGGRQTHRVFDGCVAVDERQAKPPRKAPADRRLSNSHQPHQHDRPVEMLPYFSHSRGYTAAHPVGKSARMSRLILLIVILLLIIGGLFYLSTVPKQQPTHTIEVAVPQGAPAGGNAH